MTMSLVLIVVAAVTLRAITAHAGEGEGGGAEAYSGHVPGYRLIWYELPQMLAFGAKYSGALGTYTAKHHPLAVYCDQAHKTFFVYGGTPAADQRHLLAMASHYDHATGELPQPTIVHDKQGVDDPHDNPSIQMDGDGYLWVFVSGRGSRRPGFIYHSAEPRSTDPFVHVREDEFTYPQPWWIDAQGFILLFTKYTDGRELYWATSPDGREWSEHRKLAGMGGHYQLSNERNGTIITAFNMHPGGSVDRRTNLYFAKTDDMGRTWRSADGQVLELPLTDPDSPAMVRDYQSQDRLVYMKDINFDRDGNPVILYLTAASFAPGPDGEPRTWTIAHWQGEVGWVFREVTQSTHNYDMGSLYIENDGTWRIIAPTEPGPQHWGTGGEVAVWISTDQGQTWAKARDVTRDSKFNHAYVRRPVNAHPDFYAFWADADPDECSPSRLYFTNRAGDTVRQLPYDMEGEREKPRPMEQWE